MRCVAISLFFPIPLKLPFPRFVELVLIVLACPGSPKENDLAVTYSAADTRALPMSGNRFERIFRRPCRDSKFEFYRDVTLDLVQVNALLFAVLVYRGQRGTHVPLRPTPPSS